ncbi:hypothetical protein [Sphingomonas sp. Leaf242]|uniref:hypothetical protein n=1 Tax=Sphingomonas sp. Leaf242 TaxID=1736304 RepID=UPI000715EAFE|nr:hypothetical protein [Sphingomonas sp. Leaf242]KQO13296.1 hypothetical protein ASF09_03335 [Sphingomonas sp. Leaf242]
MKHAPDMVHPLLDEFAYEYYAYLPRAKWAALGVDQTLSDQRLPWFHDSAAIRDQFRQVAKRFIDGDETLTVWRLKQGD